MSSDEQNHEAVYSDDSDDERRDSVLSVGARRSLAIQNRQSKRAMDAHQTKVQGLNQGIDIEKILDQSSTKQQNQSDQVQSEISKNQQTHYNNYNPDQQKNVQNQNLPANTNENQQSGHTEQYGLQSINSVNQQTGQFEVLAHSNIPRQSGQHDEKQNAPQNEQNHQNDESNTKLQTLAQEQQNQQFRQRSLSANSSQRNAPQKENLEDAINEQHGRSLGDELIQKDQEIDEQGGFRDSKQWQRRHHNPNTSQLEFVQHQRQTQPTEQLIETKKQNDQDQSDVKIDSEIINQLYNVVDRQQNTEEQVTFEAQIVLQKREVEEQEKQPEEEGRKVENNDQQIVKAKSNQHQHTSHGQLHSTHNVQIYEQATHVEATHEEATHEEATHEEATHEEATHEEATHEEAIHEQATHEQATHEQATHEQGLQNYQTNDNIISQIQVSQHNQNRNGQIQQTHQPQPQQVHILETYQNVNEQEYWPSTYKQSIQPIINNPVQRQQAEIQPEPQQKQTMEDYANENHRNRQNEQSNILGQVKDDNIQAQHLHDQDSQTFQTMIPESTVQFNQSSEQKLLPQQLQTQQPQSKADQFKSTDSYIHQQHLSVENLDPRYSSTEHVIGSIIDEKTEPNIEAQDLPQSDTASNIQRNTRDIENQLQRFNFKKQIKADQQNLHHSNKQQKKVSAFQQVLNTSKNAMAELQKSQYVTFDKNLSNLDISGRSEYQQNQQPMINHVQNDERQSARLISSDSPPSVAPQQPQSLAQGKSQNSTKNRESTGHRNLQLVEQSRQNLKNSVSQVQMPQSTAQLKPNGQKKTGQKKKSTAQKNQSCACEMF